MPIDPKSWTREELERHSVDMRQFIDFRQSTLPNGMRIIEAYNSSGLTFTILPDRGLDIWTAHYKGIPLTWISQGSPHPPDFGQMWLQQFNGGLLTTCGLTHVGPPEKDDVTGELRDLHGDYTRLRAQEIWVGKEVTWFEDEELYYGDFDLGLRGTVCQSSLFGEQLRLERTIWLSLRDPSISLSDTIINVGDKPVPLMLLYHINLGFPLIQEGVKLLTPYEKVYPRDAVAHASYNSWATYETAVPGYVEQVFFHRVKTGLNNKTSGLLFSNAEEDFGLYLQWDTSSLPYLTQWKNTRQGIYVCGIEPGNCIPEGLNAARKNDRLMILEPGANIKTHWSMHVIEGIERIQHWKNTILTWQSQGQPVPNCHLDDYAQFAQQE